MLEQLTSRAATSSRPLGQGRDSGAPEPFCRSDSLTLAPASRLSSLTDRAWLARRVVRDRSARSPRRSAWPGWLREVPKYRWAGSPASDRRRNRLASFQPRSLTRSAHRRPAIVDARASGRSADIVRERRCRAWRRGSGLVKPSEPVDRNRSDSWRGDPRGRLDAGRLGSGPDLRCMIRVPVRRYCCPRSVIQS